MNGFVIVVFDVFSSVVDVVVVVVVVILLLVCDGNWIGVVGLRGVLVVDCGGIDWDDVRVILGFGRGGGGEVFVAS